MRFRPLLSLAALSLAALPAATNAATPFPVATTWLLSGTDTFDADLAKPTSGVYVTPHAVSGDGRYVTFSSGSDGLSTEDDDASEQVYVKDRTTDALTLVSRQSGAGGAPIGGDGCQAPTISRDGQWIAFTCYADTDGQDTNDEGDVYARNWLAAEPTTVLVSHRPGLTTQPYRSEAPVLSENGEYIAFESQSPLVVGDTNNAGDVYRAHISTATKAVDAMALVSRASTKGAIGDTSSFSPSISHDGQRIAFTSNATNLDGGGASTTDAFLAINPAAANNTTQRVAGANGTNAAPTGDAYSANISGDGAYVVYSSNAANLVAADTTNDYDVFLRAVGTKSTSLVSAGANVDGSNSTINRDGTVVGFASESTTIDPDATTPSYRTYVSEGGKLRLVSRRDGDAGAPNGPELFLGGSALSDSGKVIVLYGDGGGDFTPDSDPNIGGLWVRDNSVSPATTRLVSRGPGSASVANDGGEASILRAGDAVSADGRRVVYESSWERNLSSGAVIVRDTQTGAKIVASRADGPTGAINNGYGGVISADGNRVAWLTSAKLDPQDQDDDTDVYLRDLTTNRTYFVSVSSDGANSNAYAALPDLDATGDRVTFTTSSTNLSDGDVTVYNDVYVRDIATGRTSLVSARNGTDQAGNHASYASAISADGAKVAFETTASDLGGGDGSFDSEVYLRDLATRTTALVSSAAGGGAADGLSSGPSISADGSRVAFSSTSTMLVAGVAGNADLAHAYVRDLASGVTSLVGRANGESGSAAALSAYEVTISADGTSVAFVSRAANLGLANPKGVDVVYVRDMTANTTGAASVTVSGAAPAQGVRSPSLTADGACVVFAGTANLIAAFASQDFDHVYLRALKPGCVPALSSGGPGPIAQGTEFAPPKDTLAPVLSKVSVTNARFKASAKATAVRASASKANAKKKAKTGTTFKLTLSEAATVTLVFEAPTKGKKTKGVCRASTKKVAKKKACTAYKAEGTITRSLKAGAQSIAFTGRLGKKALRPGIHRVTVRAADAAGNAAKSKTLSIAVLRR